VSRSHISGVFLHVASGYDSCDTYLSEHEYCMVLSRGVGGEGAAIGDVNLVKTYM